MKFPFILVSDNLFKFSSSSLKLSAQTHFLSFLHLFTVVSEITTTENLKASTENPDNVEPICEECNCNCTSFDEFSEKFVTPDAETTTTTTVSEARELRLNSQHAPHVKTTQEELELLQKMTWTKISCSTTYGSCRTEQKEIVTFQRRQLLFINCKHDCFWSAQQAADNIRLF